MHYLEPSGPLPNRLAILGVVPGTGTISALGPLSRRAPDDGVLGEQLANQNTRQNKITKITVVTIPTWNNRKQ